MATVVVEYRVSFERAAPSDEMCQTQCDQLLAIFDRYASWEDRLSERIFTWGASACGSKTANELAGKIGYLANQILVNPLNGIPLESPMLDQGWVWEKWMLDEYKECCNQLDQPLVSPFTGKPFQEMKHAFVAEVMEWLQTFLKEFGEGAKKEDTSVLSRALSVQIHKQSLEMVMLKLFVYKQLTSSAMKVEEFKLNEEKMRLASEQALQMREEVCAEIAEHEKEAKARAHVHEVKIHGAIADVRREYQAAIAAKDAEIKSTAERQAGGIEELRQALSRQQSMTQQHEAKIVAMRQRIAQREAQIRTMQQGGKKSRGFCSIC